MNSIRVLMITSEWPSSEHPNWVPFLVQQVNYLRKAGIDIDVFPFRGSKNPFNYLRAWRRARKALHGGRYDIIHAQFGQSGLVGLPQPIPLVVTFHGSDLQGDVSSNGLYTFQGQLLKLVSQFVALVADEVIVVSPSLEPFVNRRVACHVIPCGIDLELFRPLDQIAVRRQLNLPLDKKFILFGGRPEMPVKRYELARQAVNLLGNPNFEMIVPSKIPHHQMPLYLNACDILLLTSLHEGSPTIVKEALACNIPIVSTNVGDVLLRVRGVDGCIVCNDERPETIAAALEHVLSRHQRVNGRQVVINLDEKLLTQQVLEVYRKAIDNAKQQKNR